jgi:hypothetical protein
MVKLLFISDNSKIDVIKIALKTFPTVKIDRVSDFDHGLKDVLEKRPAMVFIQDQIAGVSGESVARHIQMLLGTGAPSFIFMHDGDLKAKPIKGLFDYLIDLSQDNVKVLAGVKSTIKVLLGPTREKIYVPSKAKISVVKATPAVPEEHRALADKLVDDFLSDLGNETPAAITASAAPDEAPEEPFSFASSPHDIFPITDFAAPDISTEEPFVFASSPHEQLEEIISEYEREQLRTDAVTPAACNVKTEKLFSPSGVTTVSAQDKPPAPLPESSKPELRKATVGSESPLSVRVNTVPAAPIVQKKSAPIIPGMSERSQSPPISPADFRIVRERSEEDAAVEESMRAFEANYLSMTAARKRYQAVAVVLVLCLAGAGWYLVKQKPHPLQSVVKIPAPATAPAPATQPVAPVPVIQKSSSATQRPKTAVLPSFIPLAGHDRSFASQKPGWERYVGTDSEFRVFHSAGKLKAVQVLATKSHVISESKLKTILIELTGTDNYRITSLEQQSGFQVIRATVNRKADLLIYRKKSAAHALVVSLD